MDYGIFKSSTLNSLGLLELKGNWDANANSPTLASGIGNAGDAYRVSVPGTTNIDGENDWNTGDIAWFGTDNAWHKIDNTDAVTSFNSRTGAVVPALNDYTWAQINKAVSDIADITTKSHTSLSDIGTKTHNQLELRDTVQALVDGANIDIDFNNGWMLTLTQAGSRSFNAPTNIQAGGKYYLEITQSGNGNTLAWDAVFTFPGGTDPIVSSSDGDIDVFEFVSFDGSTLRCVANYRFS